MVLQVFYSMIQLKSSWTLKASISSTFTESAMKISLKSTKWLTTLKLFRKKLLCSNISEIICWLNKPGKLLVQMITPLQLEHQLQIKNKKALISKFLGSLWHIWRNGCKQNMQSCLDFQIKLCKCSFQIKLRFFLTVRIKSSRLWIKKVNAPIILLLTLCLPRTLIWQNVSDIQRKFSHIYWKIMLMPTRIRGRVQAEKVPIQATLLIWTQMTIQMVHKIQQETTTIMIT